MKCSKFHIGIQIRFKSSSFPQKGKLVIFHRGAETLKEAHGIIGDFKKKHGEDFLGAKIYELKEII